MGFSAPKHIEFLFFSALLFFATAHSDLKQHLKPCTHKSDVHKPKAHGMRNIDFIYLINLDQRPERYQTSLDQLTRYGIEPYRFSAVNGWELSIKEVNDIGLKYSHEMRKGLIGTCYLPGENFEPNHQPIDRIGQNYFCHCLSRGAIGCALSHVSVLQDAFDAGYETIWVMEDDIEVLKNPHLLSDLIERLDQEVGKGNWDIFFTDEDIRDPFGVHKRCYWAAERPDFGFYGKVNDYAMKRDVGSEFRQIGARWGSHSMILRRSGIKKLLQFFYAHQIFFPYDMEYVLPTGIKLYTVREDVVSNLTNASSDNGGANYLSD